VSIHPSAVIARGAIVPESCAVGPFCTIGPEVELGEDCALISHVVLDGHTRIGARNIFHPFAAVGVAPQDLKYGGESTETVIGDGNTIRESVTISRGTVGGGGITRIGSGNLLMTCVHIGHDSLVGSHCILANAATLAGHVIIEDYGRGLQSCASTLHRRPLCIHRRRDDCDPGCAAVFQDLRAAREQGLRGEQRRFGAERVQPGADQGAAKGFPAAAGVEAEHDPGS